MPKVHGNDDTTDCRLILDVFPKSKRKTDEVKNEVVQTEKILKLNFLINEIFLNIQNPRKKRGN